MNVQKKLRVLITGASSGLGQEMALQLGQEGCRVAITGRREDRLREASNAIEAAGGECLGLLGDVTDYALVKSHYALIREKWGGLDWAVLNAGISDSTSALNFSAQKYHHTFAVNIGGVVNWMEAVLPDMIKARSGTIAGISSLASFKGLPQNGAYCASKAALSTLLESTRVDLRDTGVSIVTVCPGFVKSEITAKRNPDAMPFLLETEDGARRILRGIRRQKRVVHFPWQLSYPMKYLLGPMPSFLYDWLASKVKLRPHKGGGIL